MVLMSRGRAVRRVAAVALAAALAVSPGAGHAAAFGRTAPASAPADPSATATSGVTEQQALAQARAAGRPVPVTAATTATSTLTANPAGTLTLSQTLVPVRANVGGTWRPLDATLVRQADGSLSPALAAAGLRLSSGGTGPLATMTADGASMSLTLPVRLPAPTLSGPIATYRGVLPGIDLEVTADTQGGFSEVIVVRDAAAAANPKLRSLTFTTRTTGGLRVQADAAGNIAATTRGGATVFTAPAPTMWDSTPVPVSVPSAVDPDTGTRVDTRNGDPLASSTDQPGEGAHVAPVGVHVTGTTIALTPDASLLTGRGTVFPLFIDPTYSAGGTRQAWTYVSSAFPTTSYWKTSDMLRVGYDGWESPYLTGRTFVRESVPSTLYTATIYSSTIYFTEEWSPSCSAREADLYWTGAISSATTWDDQPSWNTKLDSANAAHGYDSSCPAADVSFDVTGQMKTAASQKWTNATFGLRAANESDEYAWKKFSTSVSMSTTYDHAPAVPTDLATSPGTACGASAPTTVGNGDLLLYARVSDPDGGAVSASFEAWNTATAAGLDSATVSANSGTTATLRIPQATLDAAAGGATTEFSWQVQASDGTLTSAWSATCDLYFNPDRPGAPAVTADQSSYTIGTPAGFAVAANGSSILPSSYTFQLNADAGGSVNADATGAATITVTPTRGTDVLTVTAVAAGSDVGDTTTVIFDAAAAAPAVDGDLTGDGIPDLVTVGGTGGVPSGLWLAPAQAAAGGTAGDGQVVASAVDLGVEGNGFSGDYQPSDFDGAHVITGRFTDRGLNDLMVYYPSGPDAGEAAVLDGTGDGSAVENQDAADSVFVPAVTFSDPDPNGDVPMQVSNGYNADPSDDAAYPDLITRSGDATNGYYLEYYQNAGAAGSWLSSVVLANPTPDGTMDWNDWLISTTQSASGSVEMFLWSTLTDALYLWTGVTIDDATSTASFTQNEISADWTAGGSGTAVSRFEAADINGDGVPDLWTVTPAGIVTAWLVTGLSPTGTANITAQPAQSLQTATHAWRLGDGVSGQATTAADTGGGSALPLSGTPGATWDTSGVFDPAVDLDGSSGDLTTTAPAVDATKSFTLSVWAEPTALGGTILSETGSSTSAFVLFPATDGTWHFDMSQQDTTSPAWDTVAAGATVGVKLGEWTHLTATYDATTHRVTLYVDGVDAAGIQHTTAWTPSSGSFTVGRDLENGAYGGYFAGSVADVQVWSGIALTPVEAATLSGTTGYVMFPSDGTVYQRGATWTTSGTYARTLTLQSGGNLVLEDAAGSVLWSSATGGDSTDELKMQTDGNLVIYKSTNTASSNAAWSSGTSGHPGDTMFLQPDGNLVIYDIDGTPLWSTGTSAKT